MPRRPAVMADGGAFASRARCNALSTLWRGLLDLVLPLHCVSCERPIDAGEEGTVCGRCWTRLELLPLPQCVRCGHPSPHCSPALATAPRCRWCALLPPFVRAARSVCWVGGEGDNGGTGSAIVHALKYRGWERTADGMAERMSRLSWPADVAEERALVVPVPLAAARVRERGFNQSALLASALARRWGVPEAADALARMRATRTQTRLTPGERLANVRGAFRVNPGTVSRVRGAHVVLVDDVVTTCATLNACAAALFDAGARIVSYVTFGRARTPGDRH